MQDNAKKCRYRALVNKTGIIAFFIISALWFLMLYYTLVPWLMNEELPRNNKLDISFITIPLLCIYLLNTTVWLAIYSVFPFIRNKVINHQRTIIRNSSYNQRDCRAIKQRPRPLVSIIIPARNEEPVIRKTVLNCLQQTWQNTEVIVICHNSTDRTYEEAQVRDPRVKVIDLKTSEAGKGIALNHGVDLAQGKFICVIDSDGKLSSDFLENLMPFFDEGYAAVQGRIVGSNRDYNILSDILGLEQDLFSFPFMSVRSFFDKRTPLGGTGVVIRKNILLKVGKFGNELIDDFELSFRLYRNKYRIAFAPLSVVYDEKPGELGLMFRQRSRWIKGHIDLLKQRIAEPRDIVGHIYWLSPVFIVCGLISIVVISFSIIHFMLFGIMPFNYAALPVKIWLILTGAIYLLQASFLIREPSLRKLRNLALAAILVPFTNYWYVLLLKAFFVKSWANTKTTHGFQVEKQIIEEEQVSAIAQ